MGLKPREFSSLAKAIPQLKALCLAFPNSSEKMAWGDPTWRVSGRIFAMQKGNYAGGRVLRVDESGRTMHKQCW